MLFVLLLHLRRPPPQPPPKVGVGVYVPSPGHAGGGSGWGPAPSLRLCPRATSRRMRCLAARSGARASHIPRRQHHFARQRSAWTHRSERMRDRNPDPSSTTSFERTAAGKAVVQLHKSQRPGSLRYPGLWLAELGGVATSSGSLSRMGMTDGTIETEQSRWRRRQRIREWHGERPQRPDARARDRTLDGSGSHGGVCGFHDAAFRTKRSQERRARTVNSLYRPVNPETTSPSFPPGCRHASVVLHATGEQVAAMRY